MQTLTNAVVFLLVELIAGLTLLRGVHHELEQTLTDDGRAQANANELVDLRRNLGVESHQLEVSTALTALADHTLGHTVQGGQFNVVVLAGELVLQLTQALLERSELALEDVGLVDLIGEDDQLLLGGEVDHALDVRGAKGGTRGVTRVDDHNGADVSASRASLRQRGANGVHVGTPGPLFLEVVGDALSVEEGEGGSVQGVLGNRDEHASVGAIADDAQEGVHTGRGTGAQEQVLRVGGVAITLLDEVGNTLADDGGTLAVTVGADALNVGQKSLCAVENILLVPEGCAEGVGVLQQLRVLEKTEDLTEEGDGLLVQLLRVSDVGEDDAVEGQRLVSLGESHAVLLGLDGQLTTDGILGLLDLRVDVVDVQAAGGLRGEGATSGVGDRHGGLFGGDYVDRRRVSDLRMKDRSPRGSDSRHICTPVTKFTQSG